MRRIFCFCLLLCLCLVGCGDGSADRSMQQAVDFRTALMSAGGCVFQAEVSADFGEKLYEFTLQCDYTPDDTATLTVTAPEMIAGIEATVSADGAKVTFDGTELDFGRLANGRVAPMALPWLLGRAWSSEYISSAGKDGETTVVTCLMGYGDEEITVDTWLDKKSVPIRCDVSCDGMRCLAVTISDFRYK